MIGHIIHVYVPNYSFSVFHGLLGPLPRNYPAAFGAKLVQIYAEIIATKRGTPVLPPNLPSAEQTFAELEFDDVWQDAQVVSMCHYLRGSKKLQIPESFKHLLPNKL